MATKKYDDQLLESLYKVYQTNPEDLDFKKYFALELYKNGELKDARPLLVEVFEVDKDLNVEHALNDIVLKLDPESHKLGFVTSEGQGVKVPQSKKDLITFANVAGMDEVKEAIRTDIIYPFQHPEMYAKYNKQAGGGILMFGPPGCGKTYIARASAGEINAEFVSASIHELLSSYAGEGERSLHYFFELAREKAPAVMFFDEIDAIGSSRSGLNSVVRPLVNQLLTEMDGLEDNNKDLLIIGATNLPWEVDSALRRPGRFDKILFVPPPDKAARARLFELNMAGKPHDDIDYTALAEATKQYSAADIVHICDEASEETFKVAIRTSKEEKISHKLLKETTDKSHSSIKEWFDTVRNYIEYSNEAGLFDQVKDYLQKVKDER
ncbi:MAG TPA: ATP-binding protein [Candidatus Saccharimonadales bacterium]|nr:ATP-binding protein [Candidatus Saccharimonadales bacterium]